jgi:hypothetical protein
MKFFADGSAEDLVRELELRARGSLADPAVRELAVASVCFLCRPWASKVPVMVSR